MKTIYLNGNILTLTNEKVNALIEEDGKIIALGNEKELYQEDMKVVDLMGCTLLPSFIDGHSHFSGVAMSLLQLNLSSCSCIDDVVKSIQNYIHEHESKDIIMCQGYDHLSLKEKRHITRKELDDICQDKIIILQHQSGHNGIMNTKALQFLNIDKETYVQGGYIDFKNGFLEENAFIDNVKKFPMSSIDELKEAFIQAQNIYASYGITTIQEGMLVDELYDIYKILIKNNIFFLDVVGYIGFDSQKININQYKNYQNHFRIGGYKMFLDGSPQNKTAWTIKPYMDGTFGYPTMTDEQIENCLKKAIQENIQILAHCNGDQAIAHYINAYEKVKQQDIRPVIIHAQMMNEEQIKKAKKLNMIASFFVAHVYYFGDIHKQNLGEKRVKTISPLNTALKNELIFTLHQDSPVLKPNMLETISIAVHRKTKSGISLGKEECISILDALKSVTINASYQYHEENKKGTLSIGKKADMIILSGNPLTDHLEDIKVLKTIKDGKVIWQKN